MVETATTVLLHRELTAEVLGAFYQVYNAHGFGFLESVYRRSMEVALRRRGVMVQAEAPFAVEFLGEPVGQYRADLVVGRNIIVECKASEHLPATGEAQVLNYLRASGLRVGLLLNFGPKPTFRRIVR